VRATGLYIHGELVTSSGEPIERRNPATGKVVATVHDATPEEVDRAVISARTALDDGWAQSDQRDRAEILRRMAALIRDRATDLVSIEVEETGRPVSEVSVLDIPETADCFDYYASAIRVLRGDTVPVPRPYIDYTAFEPVGVVAALVPWNFPLNLASWKLGPALAMGNAVVLKPSELTSGTALMLAQIGKDAGLPDGVLNVLTGLGRSVGQTLISHPRVDMVAFTGGGVAGRAIAGQAASLGKKVALELGGKSAQVVFADADQPSVVASVLEGAFFALGQNCCAGSRLLLEETIADDILKALVAQVHELRLGDPSDESTQVGCVISPERFDIVSAYIEAARDAGAIVHARESRIGVSDRAFIPPTVIVNPPHESRVVQEEIFGPVLVVNTFSAEDEAIRLANDTKYDLAAGVWTRDIGRAHRVSRRLRAGSVWINTYNRVFNDMAFGGMGFSGHGRDLGLEALMQYTNVKNICIATEAEEGWY
jgi:acyl-CoA reductase-like NAD-dependent aldehyde dehydrogenase